MPGLGAEMIRRLGAVPTLMAPGDVFPALQSGTLDATDFTGPANDMALYHFSEKDSAELNAFYNAGSKFLPGLKPEDLSSDYIGVRSKLFKDGIALQGLVYCRLRT